MTAPLGHRSTQATYDLRGCEFTFSGEDEDRIIHITKTSPQGYESTLTIRPDELTVRDRIEYTKLVMQHTDQRIEASLQASREEIQQTREAMQETREAIGAFNERLPEFGLAVARVSFVGIVIDAIANAATRVRNWGARFFLRS